jgi:hypothetical protein
MPATKMVFTTAAALACLAGPALAQQGTEAQRNACMPDAFRLCSQFIPDAGRIEGCLRDAGPRLSPACYVVFYPPAAAKPPLRTARQQARRPAEEMRRPVLVGDDE